MTCISRDTGLKLALVLQRLFSDNSSTDEDIFQDALTIKHFLCRSKFFAKVFGHNGLHSGLKSGKGAKNAGSGERNRLRWMAMLISLAQGENLVTQTFHPHLTFFISSSRHDMLWLYFCFVTFQNICNFIQTDGAFSIGIIIMSHHQHLQKSL